MLPARRDVVSHALVALAPLQHLDTEVRLRVGLADGSVADGFLVSASPDHLALRLSNASGRFMAVEEIRSVHRARPRRGREWALAGVGAVGATAALVGLVSLPVVGDSLRTHGQQAFMLVFYAGAGLLVFLLARTGLRDWLTCWETLVDTRSR